MTIIAVTAVLIAAGHYEAATALAVIGAGALGASPIQVTITVQHHRAGR
ncbi:hypothetical protein [Streptomyces globosus]